jgi:UDP-glucose 4-epimerase
VGNPTVFETAPQTWAAAELQITDTIATLARLHRARNVVYLSTAGAAYGEGWRDGQGHAFRETDPCHPVSVYGQSKLAAEYRLAGLLAAPASDVSFTVLRASNIYGLRYAKGGQQGLVNALVERARLRLPITVFGDGLIYRDYLFSGDLSTALLALLLRPASGLFNIAFGRSHSILDVIAAVEAVMAIRFERLNAPARGFDVKYSGLSIENAKASLGWMPAVGLEQGIARIAAIGAA